ncbi:unnamed protein product [Brachionus calyciflorus]|uniref:Retinol dehydrogenase 12 n=1 Tax=Brachionus calyciflorus TaxID=104777 RepID=A0A813XCX0_9BILA|nr:unnamed protein product [Brachionus calyciflorus]
MLTNIILSLPPIILLGYLANRFIFRGASCKSKNRLDSKVAIVTGSNCGIGFETALDLAKRGATVILACRDRKKAEDAVEKIKMEKASAKVYFEELDLSDKESIKNFSDRIKNKYKRLDILINNAGLLSSAYRETKDGFESQFGVMHLGHFYLTYLLIDLLKSSRQSRIINVSSNAHRFCSIKWDDIMFKNNYKSFRVYQQAKLANILFTLELKKRYENDGITAVSLHPGFVKTEINRHFTEKLGLRTVLFAFFYPFYLLGSMDAKYGAQTTIHCAVADEIIQENGLYYSNCKPAKCSGQAMDENSSKRLWDLSLKLLKIE